MKVAIKTWRYRFKSNKNAKAYNVVCKHEQNTICRQTKNLLKTEKQQNAGTIYFRICDTMK